MLYLPLVSAKTSNRMSPNPRYAFRADMTLSVQTHLHLTLLLANLALSTYQRQVEHPLKPLTASFGSRRPALWSNHSSYLWCHSYHACEAGEGMKKGS